MIEPRMCVAHPGLFVSADGQDPVEEESAVPGRFWECMQCVGPEEVKLLQFLRGDGMLAEFRFLGKHFQFFRQCGGNPPGHAAGLMPAAEGLFIWAAPVPLFPFYADPQFRLNSNEGSGRQNPAEVLYPIWQDKGFL